MRQIRKSKKPLSNRGLFRLEITLVRTSSINCALFSYNFLLFVPIPPVKMGRFPKVWRGCLIRFKYEYAPKNIL